MSDDTVDQTPEETTEAPATPDVESVFVIVKRLDGSFYAKVGPLGDVVVAKTATMLDIKHGCSEILETIQTNSLANVILGQIAQNNASESDKVASSIRQALTDKGIL